MMAQGRNASAVNTQPRLRGQVGFTLIEVLTAMMVLAIGLAGVMSLVYGSSRAAQSASDRNIAAALLQEAIADIQRNHLITNPTVPPGITPQADEVGLYIETWDSAGDGSWPNLKSGAYTNATANLFPLKSFYNPNWTKEIFWPPSPAPKYYGGPLGGGGVPTGTAYRVLYKLERHPNWLGGQLSFEGMYVLTLTVYKDLNPSVHPSNATKQLEQVSDPMVVYLRGKVTE
jgi:prepilin-type N-terminal cleavage/methylation domain-containing protein